MGLHFGNLAKVRGIISYSISPYEQKAFTGLFSNGIPNTIRRFKESFFVVGIPFAAGYILYDQAHKEHKRLSRKNPAEFENDV